MNKKKWIWTIVLALLLVLVGGRIYLPYWVTDYVNKVLDEIPDHQGQIADVQISLLRGAYVIDSLVIENTEGQAPVPFVQIQKIDLSVEWRALLDGAIVGEVILDQPELILSITEDGQESYGEDVDWTEPLKELMPLQINRLELVEGRIVYKDLSADPKVNLALDQVQAYATNLRNSADNEEVLPSELQFNAVSIGAGRLNISGDINVLKVVPDMDVDVEFEAADITAFNDVLKAYLAVDAEQGKMSVYSEILITDSQLEGYVKPIIQDLKLVNWQRDKKRPLQLVWESIAGVVLELFENQRKDQFATKVPMRGDLSDPKTKILPTITNIFKNAFFQAFKKDVDDTISLDGAEAES